MKLHRLANYTFQSARWLHTDTGLPDLL